MQNSFVLLKKRVLPMKKNYNLNTTVLTPKKATVDFLLSFSKSIAVIRTKKQSFVVSKN